MAIEIPNTEPSSIVAGDTAKWTRTLADYPADDGWSLGYEAVNAGTRLAFQATADGADHAIVLSATTTATYAPGAYDWRARVTKGAEVFTVGTGRLQVLAAFDAAIDARSHARRTLEAIEATIEGRASSSTGEYEVAGRKLKYIPIADLLVLRDRYRREVASEDAAAGVGKGLSGRIQVRFGP